MSVPPQFLSDLEIRRFLTMAGWTALTYDYFLTFDVEMDHIWHTPWTTVKIMFLLNRYGTLIGQSAIMIEELGLLSHGSHKFCANFLWLQSLLVLTLSETTRALVLLRARALWRLSYYVAVAVVSVYTIYVLGRSGYTSYATFKNFAHFHFLHLEQTRVCILTGAVTSVWFSGVTSFVLDTGLFAIIAYYLYKLCKDVQQLQHSPLLRLLVRDAVLFYLVNLFHDTLGILSLSIFVHQPLYLAQVVFSYPLLNVAGQRAVLNLRGFQSRSYATRDISRSVDRQLAVLRDRSFWCSVDLWMGDLPQESELSEERSRSRSISTRTTRTTITTEERRTDEEAGEVYELEVLRAPVASR